MDEQSMRFLVEASKVLNSTLDVDALVSIICGLIVDAVDCTVCSLARLGEKGNGIEVLLAFGKSGPEVSALSIEKGRGIMGQVIETGKPLVVNDPGEIRAYGDALDAAFPLDKQRSLAVPLMRGGDVIGAVEAINKRSGGFSQRDLEMLTALAEQFAIALDNARLYARVTREIKERELLYEVGMRISSSLDLEEVMNLILECIRQVVEFDAGGIFLVDPDTTDIIKLTARGYDPRMEARVELKFGKGIVGWAAKHVEPVIVGDVLRDSRYLNARNQTRSEIVVPLVAGTRIVGVLNLESDKPGAFGEEDLYLIKTFGSQAAISIERAKIHTELLEKRRLENEIELARKIQRSFLPEVLPDIAGYDVSALNLPSEEVSGDYYDVINVSPGQWGFVIADVFGKGIPASLVMASFRASLLAEIRNNYSISTILAKVNTLIWESVEPERCVTACYGVLDTKERVLTYSNAGHFYPMLVGRDRVRRLDKGGMLLGAVKETGYQEDRVHIRRGDVLLFFTDGLTEARDLHGEPFGDERLVEVVRGLIDRPSADIVEGVHHEIWKYSEGKVADDFTMLVVKAR